jgi:hypothetical protein
MKDPSRPVLEIYFRTFPYPLLSRIKAFIAGSELEGLNKLTIFRVGHINLWLKIKHL